MSGICIWSSTMFSWRNRRVHHDGTSTMGGSLPMIIYTDTSQEEKKKKRGISSFWTAAASQLGREDASRLSQHHGWELAHDLQHSFRVFRRSNPS